MNDMAGCWKVNLLLIGPSEDGYVKSLSISFLPSLSFEEDASIILDIKAIDLEE